MSKYAKVNLWPPLRRSGTSITQRIANDKFDIDYTASTDLADSTRLFDFTTTVSANQTLATSDGISNLYGAINWTAGGNGSAILQGVEGVARSRSADEAITLRGGHFRFYISDNASYAGSTARTAIGCEISARAGYNGSNAVAPEVGTAFVGARIWMAPYFASDYANINNFHGLWIYNEHATQAVTNAIKIGDAGGGYTNDINFQSGNTIDNITTGILDSDALLQWSAGVAITAGNYQVGRNADGTNQLHFNVPTGAGFEWSVNDVAVLTLGTTGTITSTLGAGDKVYIDGTTTANTGTAGVLDIDVTSLTASSSAVNISTTNTATTGNTAYGLYNSMVSTAVVTGTTQNLYGFYNTVSKTGADTSVDTTNIYGIYSSATYTGSTVAGTKNTYGAYITATGDAAGTSAVFGVYSEIGGGDTNYSGLFSTLTPSTNFFALRAASGSTINSMFLEGATAATVISNNFSLDQCLFGITSFVGSQLIIANTWYTSDFDHAVQANPTMYWHDNLSPDVINNRFGGVSHTGQGLDIWTGALIGAGTKASVSIVADNTTDIFTLASHGLVDGDVIILGGTAVPTGLTAGLPYYVVTAAANTFQVATTFGGSPSLFSDDGTAVTYSLVSLNRISFYARGEFTTTLVNGTGVFTATSHQLQNGDIVQFRATTIPTGLRINMPYYVVGVSGSTFQISYTVGGSALTFSGSTAVGLTHARLGFQLMGQNVIKERAGKVVKCTDINTATYTAVVSDFRLEVRRTSSGTCNITLPTIGWGEGNAQDGQTFVIKDTGYNAGVNNITITRSGSDKINNVAGNYTMNVSGSSITLTANAVTSDWELD